MESNNTITHGEVLNFFPLQDVANRLQGRTGGILLWMILERSKFCNRACCRFTTCHAIKRSGPGTGQHIVLTFLNCYEPTLISSNLTPMSLSFLESQHKAQQTLKFELFVLNIFSTSVTYKSTTWHFSLQVLYLHSTSDSNLPWKLKGARTPPIPWFKNYRPTQVPFQQGTESTGTLHTALFSNQN